MNDDQQIIYAFVKADDDISVEGLHFEHQRESFEYSQHDAIDARALAGLVEEFLKYSVDLLSLYGSTLSSPS